MHLWKYIIWWNQSNEARWEKYAILLFMFELYWKQVYVFLLEFKFCFFVNNYFFFIQQH